MPQLTLPMALLAVTAATVGTSVYSSRKEAKTAKAAMASQERIAKQQIDSAKEGEMLASQTAKDRLKLRQASQTKTILTSPLGVQTDEQQINKNTLGV